MLGNLIRQATCRIECGEESGTGWLIAHNRILTANHTVLNCKDHDIKITFKSKGEACSFTAAVIADSPEYDVCLLSFDGNCDYIPLPLAVDDLREGDDWQTYGYPKGKTEIGHRLVGTVAQVINKPVYKINIDLSVSAETSLDSYDGFSGAAAFCNGAVVGMILVKLGKSIGAITMSHLKVFLSQSGIDISDSNGTENTGGGIRLAPREIFQNFIEQRLLNAPGKYYFLEGHHGMGKTTFCDSFRVINDSIINLGSYCLRLPYHNSTNAFHRSQPEVLFDWLSTTISGLVVGRSSRIENLNYSKIVEQTIEVLNVFSDYCEAKNRVGVLFIDGLDDALNADPSLLSRLLGILPASLPPCISIVLSAPNYDCIGSYFHGRVKTDNIFSLPPLSKDHCVNFCRDELEPDRCKPSVIFRICECANGHPLYLRYLIKYANNQPDDDSLENFPILNGAIEDYYKSIWNRLLRDKNATYLVAAMARLRWSITQNDFIKALDYSEQTAFVSTISHIQHLLAERNKTGIYHSSFATFVTKNTEALEEPIHRKLAQFCHEQQDKIDYCSINILHHRLRGNEEDKAFETCNQNWVDTVVELGHEPDALLGDIEETLKCSIIKRKPTDFFVLTLLAQRIGFRYDTLFAQSSELIAKALVALERPKDALRHVLRFNTLIVSPDEALQIAFCLHDGGYDEEALGLLEKLNQGLIQAQEQDMGLRDFIDICCWHIETFFQGRLAGGEDGMEQIQNIVETAHEVCSQTLSEKPEFIAPCLLPVKSRFGSYFLSFRDHYADLASVAEYSRERGIKDIILPEFLPILCGTLLDFERTIDTYSLSKIRKTLDKMFSDIASLAGIKDIDLDEALAEATLRTLIRLGAPTQVVQAFAPLCEVKVFKPLSICKDDNVTAHYDNIRESIGFYRTKGFLEPNTKAQPVGTFSTNSWSITLTRLLEALFLYDGKSRRALVDENEDLLLKYQNTIQSDVIDKLSFTLADRSTWKNAYGIPESIFPLVYGHLTELIVDCFPSMLPHFLKSVNLASENQFGLYTEGFRASISAIIRELTRNVISSELEEQTLLILVAWKNHVIEGVENRHELVPEILQLIPFFKRLGADTEAGQLYSYLMSVSMGPSWYKEDQLSLMTDVLGQMSSNDDFLEQLPKIAGYLERASGEMTFQRYVRSVKTTFIAELAKLGQIRSACSYFRRQCCGTEAQLFAEANFGKIDKPSPMHGTRFPGGALEEQDTILELVNNVKSADWRLRWALLEIFQCGDSRHLHGYAEAYADLVNENHVENIDDMLERFFLVVGSETSTSKQVSFVSSFRNKLLPYLHPAFSSIFTRWVSKDESGRKELELTPQKRDEDNDSLYLPGVIGRNSALNMADDMMPEIARQSKLGNREDVKKQSVDILNILQEAGWNIWDNNLSDSAREAEAHLAENETNASSLLGLYQPLLHAEHHTLKWRTAQHLNRRITRLLDPEDRSKVLDAVIEHVKLMVGEASEEIEMFSFLASDTNDERPDIELFDFIVWLADHPNAVRRSQTASILLWLIDKTPLLLKGVTKKAFSMEVGYGPDIFCGILDSKSLVEPLRVWQRVIDNVDIDETVSTLKHISRLVVLERIARRASKAGATSAKVAMRKLAQALSNNNTIVADASSRLPIWGRCLQREWLMLREFGIVNSTIKESLITILNHKCNPLTIDQAFQLEKSVSMSFRQNDQRPLNRWEGRLSYALNLACYPTRSKQSGGIIEEVLRIYNPGQPCRTQFIDRDPLSANLVRAIKTNDYSRVLASSKYLHLNLHDHFFLEEDQQTHVVETLAIILPASAGKGAFSLNALRSSFRSTESPVTNWNIGLPETCCRLHPAHALFGTFTPASPLPWFMQLTKTKADQYIRKNWIWSRTNDPNRLGQPDSEGCSLSILWEGITVPKSVRFAWLVLLDNVLVTVVDQNNNQLI